MYLFVSGHTLAEFISTIPKGDGISVWFQSTSIGVAAAASSFVIEAAAAFTWLEFNAKFFSFHAKLG